MHFMAAKLSVGPVQTGAKPTRTLGKHDEARAIFTEALKLQSLYSGCDRGVACRSSSEVKHCRDCGKYLDLKRELDSLLAVGNVSPRRSN